MILSQSQQDQIKVRIREIESKVFGEFLVVVASRVTPIRWLSWVLPALFSWVGLAIGLFFDKSSVAEMLITFFLGSFFGFLISKIYFIQKIIVPNWMEQKFVRREALHYFFTHRVSRTPSQSGVLMFISLFERDIEVVVDSAIESKTSPSDIQKIVSVAIPSFKQNNLFEGILKALDQSELLLQSHFKKPEVKQNELHEELLLVGSSWD